MTDRSDLTDLRDQERGRLLIAALVRYGRIADGYVKILDVTGPQHSQIFHALASMTGLKGATVERAAEGPNARAAKTAAVNAALTALARVEPTLNTHKPRAAERRLYVRSRAEGLR